MTDHNSGEDAHDQFILGLSPKTVKTINFLAVIFGVVGIVAGVAGTLYGFHIQRQQQMLQLNIAVANLAAQEKPEITSPFIHNNLKWMYRESFPMTGIAVPGTIFRMVAFENVDWRGVNMKETEFACSDQVDDRINDWAERSPKVSLCTRLKRANFTGASLREARFDYADLRNADFTAAILSEASIHNSVVSGTKFLEGVSLKGITINRSEFTRVKFSSKAKFRCTTMNKECPLLRRSDFSSAEMNDVLFRGTELDRVDLSGAKLKKVRFDCESKRGGKQPCTMLDSVCFRGADLTRAEFVGTTISMTDFTGANLAGANFSDVKFDRVVLTREQEAAVEFGDERSRVRLHNARQEALVSENQDEIPCSPEWNRKIKGWKDRFALTG